MIATRIAKKIRRTWTEWRPAAPHKIVGIGLPKTGTTTLGICFERYGFKHRSYDMDLAVLARRQDFEPVLRDAERHEAFEDWPWFLVYREMDRAFPGSKFILTVRKDTETYVRSLRGHHERARVGQPEFVKPHWWDGVFPFPPDRWDYQKAAQRYDRHNQLVRDYFGSRPDFMVVCWEQGDGWARLSDFLDLPCPDEPFPHMR